MKFNIAFYVHHHGSGHITRIAQIVEKLTGFDITLLGSNLKPFAHLLADDVHLIHLPIDTRSDQDLYFHNGNDVEALHYAPLNVSGISDRIAMMTDFFQKNQPLLMVVDVSVEVTLLARLAGVPTIVMRQHGHREDLPHLMAYQSAEMLLAPFSKSISPMSAQWIIDKTHYTGGFSRFTQENNSKEKRAHVAVIVGSGGTSINAVFLKHLSESCRGFQFYVIGQIDGERSLLTNVEFYGHIDDPKTVLDLCTMVVGNTGHNTVMEMASLDKRFVGIPESRPFDEQLDKANAISSVPGVKIVLPQSLFDTDWNTLLNDLETKVPNWEGIISENALNDAAAAIVAVGKRIFQ
ncbi:hypothetical protein GJU39_10440 [Pedobacter petrophilus]|uniref:Glycosyl transferase family 28 C-terminal domain-containing protein n=1 Tax=Pedobacter petrophilus TaxID=1908241 RepID=A0A7K0FZV7_9SPHI|nr:glycosyltransferase [Pedobacter petrophilus]MRX76509.1 hypothetical protein [Pedobacter petrophilus]